MGKFFARRCAEALHGIVVEDKRQIRNDLFDRGSITGRLLKAKGQQSIFGVMRQYMRVDREDIPVGLVKSESFHAAPLEVDCRDDSNRSVFRHGMHR
jgi:hypothetical protein